MQTCVEFAGDPDTLAEYLQSLIDLAATIQMVVKTKSSGTYIIIYV